MISSQCIQFKIYGISNKVIQQHFSILQEIICRVTIYYSIAVFNQSITFHSSMRIDINIAAIIQYDSSNYDNFIAAVKVTNGKVYKSFSFAFNVNHTTPNLEHYSQQYRTATKCMFQTCSYANNLSFQTLLTSLKQYHHPTNS